MKYLLRWNPMKWFHLETLKWSTYTLNRTPIRNTNTEYLLHSEMLGSNQVFHFLPVMLEKRETKALGLARLLGCYDSASSAPMLSQDKVTRDARSRELSPWMSRKQTAGARVIESRSSSAGKMEERPLHSNMPNYYFPNPA